GEAEEEELAEIEEKPESEMLISSTATAAATGQTADETEFRKPVPIVPTHATAVSGELTSATPTEGEIEPTTRAVAGEEMPESSMPDIEKASTEEHPPEADSANEEKIAEIKQSLATLRMEMAT